jgi:tellurite resistance protein TerC
LQESPPIHGTLGHGWKLGDDRPFTNWQNNQYSLCVSVVKFLINGITKQIATMSHLWAWIGFSAVVLVVLAFDLGIFHRKSREVSLKEALAWSAVWIGLALVFNTGIYYWHGGERALQFFTGYLVELSLSVDNLFVFVLVFGYFKVPAEYRHKALFWGIIGALLMRAVFIAAGITLIAKFHWVIYLFGVLLVASGIKMTFERDKEIRPERNPVLRLFRRFMDVTPSYEGGRFFVKQDGRILASPLFVVLLILESTDLVFAVDSVPAVLAITPDPFVVFTSNVFAILGLRSMFFALEGVMKRFHYLHYGLAAVLGFVGAKMLLAGFYKTPTWVSLLVIVGVLSVSIIASLLDKHRAGQA